METEKLIAVLTEMVQFCNEQGSVVDYSFILDEVRKLTNPEPSTVDEAVTLLTDTKAKVKSLELKAQKLLQDAGYVHKVRTDYTCYPEKEEYYWVKPEYAESFYDEDAPDDAWVEL